MTFCGGENAVAMLTLVNLSALRRRHGSQACTEPEESPPNQADNAPGPVLIWCVC